MANIYNPIRSITPVDVDGNAIGGTLTNVPPPSSYEYKLIDVSQPDAGNTEDAKTVKMRFAQKVRVDMKWSHPTLAVTSAILTAFNPEYLQIEYLDLKAGGWLTKRFYVGDRAGTLYNSRTGVVESVSFGIIQQMPDYITS